MSVGPLTNIIFTVEKKHSSVFSKALEQICCSYTNAENLRLLTTPGSGSLYRVAFPIPIDSELSNFIDEYSIQDYIKTLDTEDNNCLLLVLDQTFIETDSYLMYKFYAETDQDQILVSGSNSVFKYMESLHKELKPYWSAFMRTDDSFHSLDGKSNVVEFNWQDYYFNDKKIEKVKDAFGKK